MPARGKDQPFTYAGWQSLTCELVRPNVAHTSTTGTKNSTSLGCPGVRDVATVTATPASSTDVTTATAATATTANVAPAATQQESKFLSIYDQMMAGFGPTSSTLLLRHSVAAPLLRRALARVLTDLPAFAGRLVRSKDGLTYDVSANNAGARLVIASTSTTLDQVRAAVEAKPYSTAAMDDPWAEYDLPRDPAAIVAKQCPLASVLLLHLSGGGCLLTISVHHVLVDFTGLQTFAAHLSSAYNAALAEHTGNHCNPMPGATSGSGWDSSGSGTPATSGTTQANAPAPLAPPPDRAAARFDPAAVDAFADAAPLPAGIPPLELDGWAPFGPFDAVRLTARVLWNLVWRGGGMEARMCLVPADRLAALKQQAASELAEERRQREGQAATAAGAGGSGGEDSTWLEGVEWVSTADALTARVLQLLHSVPLRRNGPMTAFVAANMRPRLQPPLPGGQLGNVLGGVCLRRLRPAEASLGELAGRLRAGLQRQVVPRFRRSIHEFAEQVSRQGGVGRLMLGMVTAADPRDSALAPEGPIWFTNRTLRYDLWQFGPEAPLAVLPPSKGGPNVIRYFPAPDGTGMYVAAYLHRAAWRQLDAMTGGDLAAAI